MSKYKQQGFFNTFRNARKGMRLTIKSERNIRVHLTVGALVICAAFLFHFSVTKFCILLLTITSVICAEMMNSAIEFALDSIYHNKFSRMVGMAKDIAAGAVMVVTITAVMIGVLLFVPAIVKVF
ncbi:MAG TPA: diacylglycerol kinase [Cyanobacteria bacterium UBA11991]|nr:diacylglycerol kinase family protein [Cyanobacteriota bacterium]MDY6358535.1 diacylglycerol kinase family protein [Cyanobacteriota bacterium]MDY6364894.1 diacylglycerol kinase family protein [Cyanobacteriota bacterium]MDY6383358.1 diacylglycerol kinase family protein [Cyanobacteriota bacterium]HCB11130.1 diacylglycerol kinase [Cyanobacteria bacterium UBA11991]